MEKTDRDMRFRSLDSPEDLLIEAMVAERNNPDSFHPIAFRASAIDYVMHVSDRISAIILKSAVIIPVAKPFQELKKLIYTPDLMSGSSIDLSLVTGRAVRNAQVPKLADEFNKASLKICAFLRQQDTRKEIKFDFSEDAMSSYQEVDSSFSKPGKVVSITFNSSSITPPFNGSGKDTFLDMTLKDFTNALAEAKRTGQSTLDLRALFAANPDKYGCKPQ